MQRTIAGIMSVALIGAAAFFAGFQPPAEDGEKKGKDKKGNPPRYQVGNLFPPQAREGLKLTAEQEKQVADLQNEVKEKLTKILTADQLKFLEDFRPPRGPGGPGGGSEGKDGPPPDDKNGPPEKESKEGRKDGPPERGNKKEGRPERPDMEN